MAQHPLPPVVICEAEPDGLDRQARPRGSRDGFSLPVRPWDLAARGWTCVGAIDTADDAAGAIEALTRGVALTISIRVDGDLRHRLLEDLHRLGRVSMAAPDGPGPPRPVLEPEQEALLQALAGGATLAEASRALHVSLRTANRRLAEVRSRFGVTTTAEVLARWAHEG